MRASETSVYLHRLLRSALLLFAALVLCLLAWVQLSPAPPLAEAEPRRPSLILLTAQGEPFARRGEHREVPVNAARLPPQVIAPFLAIEDRRFFEHGGIDPRGITRAALANVAGGGVEQGGSTITQQLAKIAFVGNDRSFARKLREAVVALRLEKHYGKDEILSAYLSRAYFGDGVYGLGAAARHYFAKDVVDLAVEEAAMLAGVVNAPSRLAPTRHPEAAQARSRVVLAAMVDAGHLTAAAAAALPPAHVQPALPLGKAGSYFADWVQPQARAAVGAGYGQVAVPTTLDGELQQAAEAAVARALARDGVKSGATQAALIAMRPDGTVAAMVGGRDYARSQYNRAVQAERQPGSAFKLFVYLAALRAGADPETVVSDGRLKMAGWSPKNFGGGYGGQVSLQRAFAQSSNVAAVRISERVGRDEVIRAARDLGLDGELKPLPSLALGTSSTTLLDLTSAYAGVAAGAYAVSPVGLPGESNGAWQVQTPMPFYERDAMLRMLGAAVETGTGRNARLPIPAFGKTGTTQDHRDAWFVGFAGDFIVGVWVGNDDETPMKGVTGGGMPAQIWRAFMIKALAEEITAAEGLQAEQAARKREAPWHDEQLRWWEQLIEDPPTQRWLS